ncbi:hypothetical protein WBS55_10250 [Bacillus luti]|uniref:ABC transporter permease n=1 Tax=Bacillus luti TaxID=2026191 RepID=A0ABU8HRJ2_9BACI|nr:hypothetical protein [Bacillus luti]
MDDQKKVRLMNLADRTLHNQFKIYDIPYNVIYEFNACLGIVYNDTNKMQRQGIAPFSVTGVGSFTFKGNNVSSTIEQPLSELIPGSVLQLIEVESEDLQLTGRVIGQFKKVV